MQQNSINVHLGQRLRQRRWVVGVTQEQLGQAVGVGFQQIHKYESGISQLTASRLWQISAALGCSVSYFFEGIEASAR